jgi:hypothetical protein
MKDASTTLKLLIEAGITLLTFLGSTKHEELHRRGRLTTALKPNLFRASRLVEESLRKGFPG